LRAEYPWRRKPRGDPVSNAFSGGNVVFGTSPGRSGQLLKTPAGDIPVFNTVLEGIRAGHSFNTGVVYLPPTGVRDGVAELIRVNPNLRKIVIITEKIAVHDAREIRAMAQANGIDIIGGNCLGVADSWNRVRIGGALGGDHPEESLVKGSVAIFSNSGGFTTTIAQYLTTAGWGTTTLISSGATLRWLLPRISVARRECSTPNRAAITKRTLTGRSRSWPASSAAGSPS
jgi:succinyl-CoA synthetase alpha subunit